MGLQIFFLTNFPGAMFIQGATFIPESRVVNFVSTPSNLQWTLKQNT